MLATKTFTPNLTLTCQVLADALRGKSIISQLRFDFNLFGDAGAIALFDSAIASRPNYSEAHHTRGEALQILLRLDEATASYDKAIAFLPTFAEARVNLALCHLLMGNFHAGWQGYEWRWINQHSSAIIFYNYYSRLLRNFEFLAQHFQCNH